MQQFHLTGRTRYVFVTGGVCSSLGKGVAAASLGTLLEAQGLRVAMLKVDPYINLDAGTMSPFQHGEVYVTDDGAETDLDLGNYARFTSAPLTSANSITTGQIYQAVINQERAGRYLGKCVQVVPHITDEIKRRICQPLDSPPSEVVIVEVGGTVGDIESIPFLEAIRQLIHELGRHLTLSVHLTLLPKVGGGEVKTKPTQHAVRELLSIGIQPDILLCRCNEVLAEEEKRKISLFTNVDYDSIISAHNEAGPIYRIPLNYRHEGLDRLVCQKLALPYQPNNGLARWQELCALPSAAPTVRIALVGKYVRLPDTYKSVDEALLHGAMANHCRLQLVKIEAEELETAADLAQQLDSFDGIIIPGGFGERGVEGMMRTCTFARQQKIPFFGICLGMQVQVLEYARSVLQIAGAYSGEFTPPAQGEKLVLLLEEQAEVESYGGTMRLGGGSVQLLPDSLIYRAYQKPLIRERHRHRYEINNRYRAQLERAGLKVSATTTDNLLVEACEWSDHPWGVGVQFHPEFTSRPVVPGPLFQDFIAAALFFQGKKTQANAVVRNHETMPNATLAQPHTPCAGSATST